MIDILNRIFWIGVNMVFIVLLSLFAIVLFPIGIVCGFFSSLSKGPLWKRR